MLAKIDGTLKQDGLHPTVKPVLFLLQNEDARWYPEGLPNEAVEFIRTLINDVPSDQLIFAVYDLIRVATTVGAAPGGKMAGGHLLRICNDVIDEKHLIGAAKGDAEFDAGALQKAKGATGQAARAQPAKVGDAAPTGSMRVDQIAPKRRL